MNQFGLILAQLQASSQICNGLLAMSGGKITRNDTESGKDLPNLFGRDNYTAKTACKWNHFEHEDKLIASWLQRSKSIWTIIRLDSHEFL